MSHIHPEIVARELWAGTGLQDTFPRNIEQAVALTLPLALVKLPVLTTQLIGQWLQRRRIHIQPHVPLDRHDLCGCLVAHRGHGFVFVCGADEPEEQRFTLAHEVAHFLVDYLWPRRQVIHALGDAITDVLDGLRPATPAERAAAILSHVHVGAHLHLLPRRDTEGNPDVLIAQAENRADQLALELVAPQERILALWQDFSVWPVFQPERACAALAVYFGLPVSAFAAQVQRLSQSRPVSFLADVRAGSKRPG